MVRKMKNNYILIQEESEKQTSSGIWLPEDPMNRKAIVLAVGEDEEEIEKGDLVFKNIGKGTALRMDGVWVEAIHRNHLLAVVKK